MLGFHCCMWAFSSCGEWRLLLFVMLRLLVVVASFTLWSQALGLQASVVAACILSSCSGGPLLPCSMWDLPGPGIKSVSPALAGRFLTTGPLGKSPESTLLMIHVFYLLWRGLGKGLLGEWMPKIHYMVEQQKKKNKKKTKFRATVWHLDLWDTS